MRHGVRGISSLTELRPNLLLTCAVNSARLFHCRLGLCPKCPSCGWHIMAIPKIVQLVPCAQEILDLCTLNSRPQCCRAQLLKLLRGVGGLAHESPEFPIWQGSLLFIFFLKKAHKFCRVTTSSWSCDLSHDPYLQMCNVLKSIA